MKNITSKYGYVGTEHYVVQVDSEPTKIDFIQQIDDLLVASPDGDVLVSWDVSEWNDEECLLIQQKDNLKELGNLRSSSVMLKARGSGPITVFITAQRN